MRTRVVAVLSVFGGVVLGGCGQGGNATPSGTPHQAVVRQVDVGRGPIGIAASRSGDVWVASADGDRVLHLPAGGTRSDVQVAVSGTPLRLALAEDDATLWVSAFRTGEVVRVDTATQKVTDRIAVGAGTEGVAEAFGSVWVVAQDDGLLARIDPATRKIVQKVEVGKGVRLVVPGADALWLDDQPGGTVVRVDPQSYTVKRSGHICDAPEDLAVVGGTVWVTCSSGDELVAFSPTNLQVIRHVRLTGTPDAITAAPDGSLLVVLQDGPTLVRLDGASGAELSRTRLGRHPQLRDQANLDVAITGKDAWVTSYSHGSVFRLAWGG